MTRTGQLNGTGRLNHLGTRPLTPPAQAGEAPVRGAQMAADGAAISATARARTGPLKPIEGAFDYKPMTLHKVEEALKWPDGAMTGAEANTVIVEGYSDLEKAYTDYMGEPKTVANWLTFGKYAGREAGVAIDRVETAIGALEDFDLSCGLESLVETVLSPILSVGFAKPLFEDAVSKARADERKLGKPMSAWDFCGSVFGHLTNNLKKLREGLVTANVEIYKNFAPAFDIFLRAESQGFDGIAAVKRQVDAGKIQDPDGLIRDALSCYRQARELGAEAATNPPNRDDLLKQREAVIKRGTMLIAIQEQYHVAQAGAFDDPAFGELVGKLTPELGLTDANGRHQLLPGGGNWADFATRMGFEQVPEAELPQAARRFTSNADTDTNLFRVTDKTGQARFFRKLDDPKRLEGTIAGVFDSASTGEVALKNMRSEPEPIATYVPGQGPQPTAR